MFGRWRLRTLSTLWVAVALLAGLTCSAVWFHSVQQWDRHLTRAHEAGIETYFALQTGQPVAFVAITPLDGAQTALADAGRFERLQEAPRPAYVTRVSLAASVGDPTGSSGIRIAVLSDRLQYKVADIAAGSHSAPALKFAELTRLLATYCSDPILFANLDGTGWQRIDGLEIWGCDAAPRDLRLPAALGVLLLLAVLVTRIGHTTDAFENFSNKLRSRTVVGGPDSYDATGPQELSEIVQAVNSYLEAERAQLSNRAILLSGVSHDLGTPATRLRLRAALIADPEIRGKLEADIDQMTGIIESVLTFTRSELNSEEPRRLSLSSLVEALVADYQDTGQPVVLTAPAPVEATADRSVFAPRSGVVAFGDASKILMHARPVALRRAISNLIDNALKYGRRATVSVVADADWATVTVEDEGGGSAAEMERLLDPFARGQHFGNIPGFGLGLTIVTTVARQHGGRVEFEDGRSGVRARLLLRRV